MTPGNSGGPRSTGDEAGGAAAAAASLGVLLNAEYSLAKLVELGRLSERLGYQSLWYTDIRFHRECYLGLAAIAAVTERLRLGPGVTDPYSRHPAITAATIATLDELSGGRALLGLGVGEQGFKELGIGQPLPVAALSEAVEAIRRLWRGESVTMDGKVVKLRDARLAFTPPRPQIPIYFATQGAQVTRLAGRVADGILISNILVPSALDTFVTRVQEGMTSAGRPAGAVAISLRVEACIADDEAAALDVMRRRVAGRLISQYPHWEYLERLGVELPTAFAEIAAAKDRRRLPEAIRAMPDEVVHRTVLAGRPDRVAERLKQVMRPEIDHIVIRPHATAGGDVGATLRTFVEEVVPRALNPIAVRPASHDGN